jgi:TonB-dependent SusC/RagA subfamily outer membrane receptor
MGAISSITPTNKILYVVDGTIMPNGENIKPANIDNIEILKGPVASALFGPDGANGAIVITTKKQKIKNLDTVIVTGYSTQRRTTRMGATSVTTLMGGITEGVTVKSTITDSLKMIATKITGAIKIYPNPVQRSQQFSIALKLKEAGLYQLHIRDAVGRIVLQKQISANAKELTEKIMTDSRWSAGIYYVSIINRKNQLVEKTSFIFE